MKVDDGEYQERIGSQESEERTENRYIDGKNLIALACLSRTLNVALQGKQSAKPAAPSLGYA